MLEDSKGSLRPVAFLAVVFSTVAVTACLITFPLVFQYVQTLQATVQVSSCKQFEEIKRKLRAKLNTVNLDHVICGKKWLK